MAFTRIFASYRLPPTDCRKGDANNSCIVHVHIRQVAPYLRWKILHLRALEAKKAPNIWPIVDQ